MKRDFATLRRKLHLTSGILLAVFITCHFSNHVLGLVSIDAMETMRRALNLFWRSLPGTVLLYGALLTHFVLALHSIYRRRTWRMPPREALKIGLGLAIPFLLVAHVVGTRVEFALSGYDVGYPQILRILWSTNFDAGRQAVALLVVWAHGCLGMWYWLRSKPGFQRYGLLAYSFALLLPVLSLTGYFVSGRTLPPVAVPQSYVLDGRTDPEVLAQIRQAIFFVLALTIAAVLLARAVPSRGRIRVTYPDGRIVPISPGYTVLEASRSAGIPHLSICGGNGRCSTCRVRITAGLDRLPNPKPAESATLHRIRAPYNVRLACQLRPTGDLTIAPVFGADRMGLKASPQTIDEAAGHERNIAVLFCDLRDFTQLAQKHLPFDTVFLLNRYFETIGAAVEDAGGVIDKFIGDGALALFGLNTTVEVASAQALAAATRIARGIEVLNRHFTSELEKPLRVAMGMHAGPAIIGHIGYGKASALTAVGDTINAASRLEGFAKEYDAQLAVSADLVRFAGLSVEDTQSYHIAIRGRVGTLETLIIHDAEAIDAQFVKVDAANPQ